MTTPTQQVIDSATNTVEAYKEIVNLKSQLITNPTTVSDQTFNAVINSSIRIEQKKLKDNNTILKINNIQPLLFSQTKIDEDNNVIAPWEFSNVIIGTRQYETDNLDFPPLDSQENDIVMSKEQNVLSYSKNKLSPEDIITSVNNIERIKGLNLILNDNLNELQNAQQLRKTFEDEIRLLNTKANDALNEISYISRQLKTETDPNKLSNLMNELEIQQKIYEQASSDRVDNQKALNDFLQTEIGRKTQVSDETKTSSDGVTLDEQQAINKLRQQYVDRMNMADTIKEKDSAYKDIVDLDTAIKSKNLSRTSLGPPDLVQYEDFNLQLLQLINERDVLLKQLSETDPNDTVKISQIYLDLAEVSKKREELSDKIIGLQDNLGFGIKVKVEDDENGHPKLFVFNTQQAEYNVDEVYYTDLAGSGSVIDETIGTLNDQQYRNLMFVTATEVFDGLKNKVIPRQNAETGQESRYTNMRPNLPDGEEFRDPITGLTPFEEYQNGIQLELTKIETVKNITPEVVNYNGIINALKQKVYDTYIKPIEDKIELNLIDLKNTLIELGVSVDNANNMISNSTAITAEQFKEVIYDAIGIINGE